jgi:hypothetical protein
MSQMSEPPLESSFLSKPFPENEVPEIKNPPSWVLTVEDK